MNCGIFLRESTNGMEKTSGALFASSADTKTFTYKNGIKLFRFRIGNNKNNQVKTVPAARIKRPAYNGQERGITMEELIITAKMINIINDTEFTEKLISKVNNNEPLNDEEHAAYETIQQFMPLLTSALERIKDVMRAIGEVFSGVLRKASGAFASIVDALSPIGILAVESSMSRTERYYYTHSKKARVRNKYFKRAKRRLLIQLT